MPLFDELQAAGLPVIDAVLGQTPHFSRPLTPQEEDTLDSIINPPGYKMRTARTRAGAIPDWATFTEAQALQWLLDNVGTPLSTGRANLPSPITSFAQVRTIIVALLDIMDKEYLWERAITRMTCALRDGMWGDPTLPPGETGRTSGPQRI